MNYRVSISHTTSAAFVGRVIVLALALFTPTTAQSHAERIKAQELLTYGNRLLQSGDAEQAAVKFTAVIEILPELAIGYINRGFAYASARRHAEALADAKKGITLAEKGPDADSYGAMAYQLRGHVHQDQGNWKLAIDSYSKSIELQPSNAKFRNGRGISYLMSGQNELALKDFDKAIELDPTLTQPYVNRAVIRRRLKKFDAAVSDIDTVLKLKPSDSMAYVNRANIFLDLKRFDDAIADYTKAISLQPKSDYFYNRGRAYLDQRNYEASIQDNTEAINREPNNHKAFYNRAIAYQRLGKVALAVADMRKSLQLNDKSAARRYNLAYLLLQAGQFAEAQNEATILINKFSEWRAPYLLRAETYAKTGNSVKANEDRRTALKLDAAWKPDEEDFFIFELTIIPKV